MKQFAAQHFVGNITPFSKSRDMRGQRHGWATSTLFTYVSNISSTGRGTSVLKHDIPTYYKGTEGKTRGCVEALASLSRRFLQCTS
jgi:hypothetical protein